MTLLSHEYIWGEGENRQTFFKPTKKDPQDPYAPLHDKRETAILNKLTLLLHHHHYVHILTEPNSMRGTYRIQVLGELFSQEIGHGYTRFR